MSGKPNKEGVAEVIKLLDRYTDISNAVENTRKTIKKLEEELKELTTQHQELWRKYCEAMRVMDVSQEGNYGFEHRAIWFLAEMRRQLNEEKEAFIKDYDH